MRGQSGVFALHRRQLIHRRCSVIGRHFVADRVRDDGVAIRREF